MSPTPPAMRTMPLEMTLENRTAVITGGSSGIGAATARRFAAAGADVALLARRKDRLSELAEELTAKHNTETLTMPTDVREVTAVEAAIEATVERFGGIDIAVANAGLARGSDVESMSTESYRAMMDTNVDGAFFLTRAVLNHLRDSEGTLVFVGSFAGEYPRPFNPVYAASKWWIRGFAKSVAAQVGDTGVGVSVINPSEVRTEFDVEGKQFSDRFEQGEVTEPEEVAEAITFAAAQEYSTVQELDIYRRDKYTEW
ncbi:MAG: short-chain dehydrogenase [Haloquadratum walsbyi J07HQW2]|jgi:Short-chain alcohol dehydrogenase of unknown specificity|uniref:Short-chain dehydrogenase n=2 Tax=Haloquadratum walsbyi TaxID=293091 RepID=U1MW41_9EURY|nr:MAG: short-chain dehydrogenase [Haloquadratum walsbyi J07HQW2]